MKTAIESSTVSPHLSWTHYRTLLHVDKPEARAFYEIEALKNNWSAEPDFVVETKTAKFLCEVNRAAEMTDQTVLAKARAVAENKTLKGWASARAIQANPGGADGRRQASGRPS